jgi:3-isopropylmalate/(R)-2-methylmalate dehydratase large subunit
MGKTLFDKVWDAHVVHRTENGSDVLYIDRHYIHEVTSPQAFQNLENRDIELWRTDKTFATADHNVPTQNQHLPISEPLSRKQVEMLTFNCEKYHIPYYHLTHPNQGIVHVIGPELGLTRPGMTIVCGDSHTSTHGAFGCIAFGIGTSQVEQVFATHCLILKRPKTMRITVDGKLSKGVGAKDLILYIISKLGIGGATGYFVEYSGEAIRDLSMEGRMTVCNMSIEMGARGGLIAPDQKTYDYLSTTAYRPGKKEWDDAIRFWKSLQSEYTAEFDFEQRFDATDIEPMVTYGTNPGMGLKIRDSIPSANGDQSKSKSLAYMDLETGQQLLGKKI